MASFDYDIGVIGAGAAGLTVASGAAQLGARTLLVEREDRLGGDCLHYGCVPSKTLIRTAHVRHLLMNAERFGLPRFEGPPVDFRAVSERIRSVVATIQKHDSVERFCGLGVRVEFGPASFADEHTVDVGGKRFSSAKWVIATGSSPAIPSLDGLDKSGYLTNREIFYLDRMPGSMIILGGGPIAVEMAQAFNRLGCRTEVFQRSGQILSREDRDMADLAMDRLAREGVSFHLNATLSAVRDSGSMKEVLYEDKEGSRKSLPAEAILVALGRAPNIGGMNLDKIGVEFDAKGIKVDDRLRTTQKHIYAAGDITGQYQFTHAAGYEGGVVVSNAVFRLPRKTNYAWLPWCTYIDPELASMGMNEKAARAAGKEYSVWTEEFRANDRSLAEGEETGRVKLLLDAREHPLGVQILGPRAGDLLCEWVAALNGKVRLSTLAAAIHPYPTLGEINKRVAGNVLAKKIFSKKVRKALSFFFNLKGRACDDELDLGGQG